MSKDVLISIHPKWVEKICYKIGEKDGKPVYEKRIEVRKTRPKQETPFKCLIYCTKGSVDATGRYLHINEQRKRKLYGITDRWLKGNKVKIINGGDLAYKCYLAEGKVIGEFVCDRITKYPYKLFSCCEHLVPYEDFDQMGMEGVEVYDYLRANDGYGWYISDLKIYDKPKELSEFTPFCEYKGERCDNCKFYVEQFGGCCRTLSRPPQSWCYVETEE